MITLRIPTKEQYAYIEVQLSENSTPEQATAIYRLWTALVNEDPTLKDKEFNRVLDNYLFGTGPFTPDDYESMNAAQKNIMQVIKRAKARHAEPNEKKYATNPDI